MGRRPKEDADMTTIYLSHTDASTANLAAVRGIARDAMLFNPDWSGADIRVARGDYTEIDTTEEIAGAQLLARVQAAIRGGEGDA